MTRKWIGVAIIGGLVSLPSFGWGTNTCVDCHESLPVGKLAAHSVAEWSPSAHARAGITCDRCHGGDAAQSAPAKAHAGVIPSRKPDSPLYFSRIPATCGGCHAAEFAEFKKSYHFAELQRTGKGPNCVTCHGAMGIRVLEPRQMELTCSLCHTQPTRAGEALVTLNQAGALLKAWEALVKKGTTAQGPDVQAAPLADAQRRFAAVQRKWHAFKMDEVLKEAKTIVQTARKAIGNEKP